MRNKEIAEHLFQSAKGYGMTREEMYKAIGSIPVALREAFVYTLYRIADKSGSEGFNV